VRRAQHPEAAQRLFEFLQRREISQRLVAAQALENVEAPGATAPGLHPDWDILLRDLDADTRKLKEIFLR
jgi:hypothetical protein